MPLRGLLECVANLQQYVFAEALRDELHGSRAGL